jgi:hypothetical protein
MVLKKGKRRQEHVLIKTTILNIVSFADGQVIVKNAEENMQRAVHKLSKRAAKYNLLT